MNSGTYGLGTSIRGPAGSGPGLAGLAGDEQASATGLLEKSAGLEQQRNEQNAARNEANKAGKAQLGSSLGAAAGFATGASYGSALGPVGGLIGGVLGALGSKLF